MTLQKKILVAIGLICVLGLISAVVVPVLSSRIGTGKFSSAEAQANAFYARGLKRLNDQDQVRSFMAMCLGAHGNAHISACRARQFPDMVLVTVVWPTDSAFQFMVNPDEAKSGVLPSMAQKIRLDSIDASTSNWNCRTDDEGNMLLIGHEAECLPTAK